VIEAQLEERVQERARQQELRDQASCAMTGSSAFWDSNSHSLSSYANGC
jgi:hypothetical protein